MGKYEEKHKRQAVQDTWTMMRWPFLDLGSSKLIDKCYTIASRRSRPVYHKVRCFLRNSGAKNCKFSLSTVRELCNIIYIVCRMLQVMAALWGFGHKPRWILIKSRPRQNLQGRYCVSETITKSKVRSFSLSTNQLLSIGAQLYSPHPWPSATVDKQFHVWSTPLLASCL